MIFNLLLVSKIMTDLWKTRTNVWNTIYDKLFGKEILNNENVATNINLETPLLISKISDNSTESSAITNNNDNKTKLLSMNDNEIDKVVHDYLLFNFILY